MVKQHSGHDISVLEQDASPKLLLYNQGYKCVPARVEVDIVYEKAFLSAMALLS